MFEPWIGKQYDAATNPIGCRLLIVGESHYTKKAEEVGTAPTGFTTEVVSWFGLEKRHTFFNRLMEIVRRQPHRETTRDEAAAFWDSVAFYNFVPVLVDGRSAEEGGAARRPDAAMFEAGARTFQQALDQLQPDAVIVCGLITWDWLAPTLAGFEGKPRDVILYDDGRSVYSRIHHPSYRNFDSSYWCSRIERLFEMAAKPRELGRRVLWQSDATENPR